MALLTLFLTATLFAALPHAALTANETSSRINIANARLSLSFSKARFVIDTLSLDGQDLLGRSLSQKVVPGGPTGHGIIGLGPYLDCYCAREGSGSYTPGVSRNSNASVELIRGDPSKAGGVGFAGFVLRDVHKLSGQRMEFYVFLRDGETGLHTFGRVAYTEPKGPTRAVVQEFRTLFAPNSALWSHLVTNEHTIAPIPKRENLDKAQFVQDATKDLRPFADDPFVKETNGYFTKYSFADEWKDHELHGLYGDGKEVGNGTWGAWMVQWNRETYYGGPIRQDLTVDGIVYDYMVSNHYGANVPKIEPGFDRTFGPNYYLFNRGPPNTPIKTLYNDARAYRPPRAFLDALATHVPNYIPPRARTAFHARVALPASATGAIIALTASGHDAQDNAAAPTAFQYWVRVPRGGGSVSIADVVPALYRVTLYADGVFGDWERDGVRSDAHASAALAYVAEWTVEESAGREAWRLGVPDRSSGEFRHGHAVDASTPARKWPLQEYRLFYKLFDFTADFPSGINYRIGTSKPERDWNYAQWSSPKGSAAWRVSWNGSVVPAGAGNATLTVQLAGVRTSTGNEHYLVEGQVAKYLNLELNANVNGKDVGSWFIPYSASASCAVRSGVQCYNTWHKYVFDARILKPGDNDLTLSLPSEATAAVPRNSKMPGLLYVQYDALRLEVA